MSVHAATSHGLSPRVIALGFGYALFLAGASAAITIGGRWLGARMALSGHSDSTAAVTLAIGPDRLSLPENTIRFAADRVSGATGSVDLYLSYPQMAGFSRDTAALFDDTDAVGRLIFLNLSQSVMSRDMTNRVEAIYRHLYDGAPQAFGHGLILHHLKESAGYKGEVLLTDRDANPTFAVRCQLPATPAQSTDADCQRDFSAGSDLSVSYRFSATLLGQWKALDAAVAGWVEARLISPSSRKGAADP